ncbi:MAG: FG-GAP-like repeat-containing protein [bacterium]
MGTWRACCLLTIASLLLCGCEKGLGAELTPSRQSEPEAQAVYPAQDFSIVDVRLTLPSGAILDFTDRPIALDVRIDLSFSRALRADEEARFENLFSVIDEETNVVPGKTEWSGDGTQMTYIPSAHLAYETTYTIMGIRPIGFDTSFKTMTCGDVDGDGRADFIVGAPGAGNERGKVQIFSGARPSGPPMAEIAGDSDGDLLGSWVAPASDVNNDGYEDLLVSRTKGKGRSDAFIVLSGKALARGTQEILGAGKRPLPTGPSVAVLEGLKSEVSVETIVGDPGFDSSRGKISIKSAAGDAAGVIVEINGVSPADRYGAAISAAGDVNGDRFADFVVGAPGALAKTGEAYIYSGAELSGRPMAMRIGGEAGDALGSAVAGIGDVNGDGRDEVLVGAPEAGQGRGGVQLFSGADIGGKAMADRSGDAPAEGFGSSVAGIGDINADGKLEIIVGAPGFGDGANEDLGRVYIFNDSDRYANPLVVLTGKSAHETLGASVASACPDPAKLNKH